MNGEPKVTECWTQVDLDEHYPCAGAVSETYQCPGDRTAVLMWREDYEQLKAKADTAEYVECVNQALNKSRSVYLAKLMDLLPKEEVSRLIDEANK